MKKPVYYVILALLVGVFLFAAYKAVSYTHLRAHET